MNKKVRNATRVCHADGTEFKSKLELTCHDMLLQADIQHDYEAHTYVILESFRFDGIAIRPITYTPDFVGDGWIIECKGWPTDSFPIRWKLMQYFLTKNNLSTKLFLVHNHKELRDAITSIRSYMDNKCWPIPEKIKRKTRRKINE